MKGGERGSISGTADSATRRAWGREEAMNVETYSGSSGIARFTDSVGGRGAKPVYCQAGSHTAGTVDDAGAPVIHARVGGGRARGAGDVRRRRAGRFN